MAKKQRKAGGIIFNEDFSEILLVKGRLHQKWGFPKGHLNRNESELDGAIREIEEETGIKIFVHPFCKWIRSCQSDKVRLFLFHYKKDSCHTLESADNVEISDIGWHKISDLRISVDRPLSHIDPQLQFTKVLKKTIHRIDAIIREARKEKKRSCMINGMIILK